MRCNYCGMQNDDTATTCNHCGKPLQQAAQRTGQATPQPTGVPHRPTLLEPGKRPDLDLIEDFPTKAEPQQMTNCAKCNYPLQRDATTCPNCGTPVMGNSQPSSHHVHMPTVIVSQSEKQPQPQPQNSGVTFNTPEPPRPQNKKNIGNGTVSFYNNPQGMFQTEFSLTPLKRNNEKHDFATLNFEGDEVALNRDNLEPNNKTITSQTQAVITCEDGKYFIIDQSDFKTTFVQAKDKIEIKDGDIVLMGSRMFEFHAN